METVKFTANEVAVLKAIAATGQKEGTLHYMVEDLVKYTGKSVNSIKGILSSLNKKDILYCYAGEEPFDGEIREDAMATFNSIINNVTNDTISKNTIEMDQTENSVMDERICRLNEIIATKLSAVSKGKREGVKAAKVAAKHIIENWDDIANLRTLIRDQEFKESQYELYCIATSRVDQLRVAEIEGGEHPILKVDNEAKHVTFDTNDVADRVTLSRMSYWLYKGYTLRITSWCTGSTRVRMVVYGTTEDLKKLMGDKIEVEYSGGDRYPESKVTLKSAETKAETTPATPAKSKVSKSTTEGKTARSKHVVGDLHPTKDWVWTEYQPGKFDWRTNKHDNPEVNRKERERDLGEDKSKPTKTPKPAKEAKKSSKPAVKVRTIDEILSRKPAGMSAPQERAFKLLRKGYRIDRDAATPQGYTLRLGDDSIVILEGVMNALINRLKVTVEETSQFNA